MAIVVYQCDVCKRQKEYQQNLEGLEKIQRCTITHGCRGKLFQVKVLDDYIRESLPDPVLGLDDWQQRKVLYNHKQTIERERWLVLHGLGTFPSVSVFVSQPTEDNPDNTVEILPQDIIVVDKNNIILQFERPRSGLAQLVARQSDPDLLNPPVTLIPVVDNLQQISNEGEIAIATRISTVGESPIIDLSLKYTTTQNTIIDKTYDNVNINLPDSKSPWVDFEKVIIKGKMYSIRSFSGIISEMFDETISSGSTFIFTGIDNKQGSPSSLKTIDKDEVYILFAQSPFATIDKVTSQYIDVSQIQDTFSFVYDSGEFYGQKSIIKEVYPLIRSV